MTLSEAEAPEMQSKEVITSFEEKDQSVQQQRPTGAAAAAPTAMEAVPLPLQPTRDTREVAASVRGLSKSFRGIAVLKDIDFDVAEGESLVLLGASGSGKTTILRIIAGLDEPDTGSIHLHGRDVTNLPARERGVGVIFQSYALFPRMTVEQNISYGLRIRRHSRQEIRETVERLLALVHLEEHRMKFPSQLSGGQQQRVAIARTLAYKPEVLLFDEAFGALDAQRRVQLRREIRLLLKQVNVPAIFITHDQEEALEIGDRIAVLNAGRIEQIGTPDEVYNQPASEYVATFLGAANFLPAVVTHNGAVRIIFPTAAATTTSTTTTDTTSVPISAYEEMSAFSDGQRVKIIFRPEDVLLSATEVLPEGCRPLSKACVEEIEFVGAYERLLLRLNPDQAESPLAHTPLTAVVDADGAAEKAVLINVTRAKHEAHQMPLAVGDCVITGLSAFRLLPDTTPLD